MYHGNTKVMLIDVNTEDFFNTTMAGVFQQYSDLAEQVSDNVYSIDFTCEKNYEKLKNPIMIKDWTGWARILSMKKYENVLNENWSIIYTDVSDGFYVTRDQLVPIWNPERPRRGFHGVITYEYKLYRASSITDGMSLRCLNHDHDDEVPNYFFGAELHTEKVVPDRSVKMDGYMLITSSKFFTGNGVCLWSDNPSNGLTVGYIGYK